MPRFYSSHKLCFAALRNHLAAKNKFGRSWIKAGTFDAGSRKEDSAGKGTLYKPTSKLAELADSFSTKKAAEEAAKRAAALAVKPDKPGFKKK